MDLIDVRLVGWGCDFKEAFTPLLIGTNWGRGCS